jgi:hypothetical protein
MGISYGAAAVDLREDRVIVSSQSFLGPDDQGGSVPNGWVAADRADMTDAVLGALVRSALAASESNLPMPDFRQPQPHLQKIFEAAGVKTEAQYVRNNRSVDVSLSDGVVRLTPTRNLGRRGFDFMTELREEVAATVDDVTLGEQVRRMWTLCS